MRTRDFKADRGLHKPIAHRHFAGSHCCKMPLLCSGGEASSDIRGLSARLNINTPLPLRNLRETALHQRLSGSDDLKPILPAVQRFEPASKCCSISSLTRSGASASGR